MMRLPAMRTALAMLVGLLGTVHLALTPLVYASWTVNALWFVGTGMAMVIAAVANVIAGKTPELGVRMSLRRWVRAEVIWSLRWRASLPRPSVRASSSLVVRSVVAILRGAKVPFSA